LLKKYKDESIQGNKLKVLVGDLFTHEIVKFINSVEVKSTGNKFDVFSNISDSVKILETIDSKELVEVVGYINKVREIEKNYTKLNIEGTEVNVNITPDLFVV
jgi:hypothetical protein